jgi:hypothetical protein
MEMSEDSAMLLTLQIDQRNWLAPALVDLPSPMGNCRTKQKERAIAAPLMIDSSRLIQPR